MHNKNTNRIGDITELKVCSKLLEEGYEVLRNVCSSGIIDIVVFSPISKTTYLIDIKTCNPYHKENGEISYCTGSLNERQKEVNIKIAFLLENKVFIKDNDEILEFKEYDLKYT
jgi:Holliday junction resolvase-like predicted endonuclease